MGKEINQLNIECPALGSTEGEKFGTMLDQAILLLNDAKAKMNSHTHASINNPPNTTLITAVVVDTVNSIFKMNNLCRLGEAAFGTQINKMVTLINELRADFNSHGHSAAGVVATEQTAAVNMVALSVTDKEIMNTVCQAFSDAFVGTRVEAIITLLVELRLDHNTHVHPTLIVNPTDKTITAASVTVLN